NGDPGGPRGRDQDADSGCGDSRICGERPGRGAHGADCGGGGGEQGAALLLLREQGETLLRSTRRGGGASARPVDGGFSTRGHSRREIGASGSGSLRSDFDATRVPEPDATGDVAPAQGRGR